MTTQHAPHTPPLWRRVISLPHSPPGWWAVGLAGPALVLTGVLWLFNRFGDGEITGAFEALLVLAWLLTAVAGGVVGFIAEARDRSLLLLIAQVPGLIIFAFIVWIPVSIQAGGETDGRVSIPLAVSLWAISNLTNIYLRERKERRANFLELR